MMWILFWIGMRAIEKAANPGTSMANRSGKFRFHGYLGHAAGAPEKGRSALDAVEAMNHMVNLLRNIYQMALVYIMLLQGEVMP
ncbi:MAG: hypothetical protein CM1200mP10_29790 [Candidatus Neomarinimicrobiota bacterium]|nr:MAG: hypothetical protein CM1200mP10_29790 [Candidatus Neomarinimicrobiota bacterium]